MIRILSILLTLTIGLAACVPGGGTMGPDGRPGQVGYRISDNDTGTIQFRMLDSVNALRATAGLSQLQLDSQLNAAAATHSLDMSVQSRPWHFGSDGSSPLERVRRAGYTGPLVGENISETYETELETLAAWMQQPDTRRIILAEDARNMGFAWHQETGGKVWWTLVMGG